MLLNMEEITKLISVNDRKSFKTFYKKYGGEYCILSKPLFSADKKIILIHISTDCHYGCEENCFYIIGNNNGNYELIEKRKCSFIIH